MSVIAIVLSVLFAFISFCIVGLILLQEGKGGGLAAMGGAAMDNLVGARNPLRKLTTIFAAILLVLIVAIGTSLSQQNLKDESIPDGLAPAAPAPAAPEAGTQPAPAAETPVKEATTTAPDAPATETKPTADPSAPAEKTASEPAK
ncbi:MAG: preprotein translocase subunit SecG [Planctomycetota bacterium]